MKNTVYVFRPFVKGVRGYLYPITVWGMGRSILRGFMYVIPSSTCLNFNSRAQGWIQFFLHQKDVFWGRINGNFGVISPFIPIHYT